MQAARTLFDAAEVGSVEKIHALLAKGANPNALENNVPAIWYAADDGHQTVVMTLLEVTDSKLLSNKHSIYGTTMLHEAAARGMESVVKAAIARGVDTNALSKHHNVPAVWYAVSEGHELVAMALLDVTDSKLLSSLNLSSGSTLLHEAAVGMRDLVMAAIARGANLDVLDKYNVPAIWYASSKSHEAVAMALLDVMDPKLLNNKHSTYGATTLHEAAKGALGNLVKAALMRGADPDALDKHNVPALWYAVRSSYEAVAMVLLEVTDSKLLNIRHSSYGTTMLHEAAKRDMGDLIKAAVARGAEPNTLEFSVPTVWYAANKGHEAAAMALLEVTDFKLLSNKLGSIGTTTFYEAARMGMWGFIKAALAKGLNPYAKNLDGQSLLEVINMSSLDLEPKKALISEVKNQHAWARRGHLVMLRRRFKQAWEAECDAREPAVAQASATAPDV